MNTIQIVAAVVIVIVAAFYIIWKIKKEGLRDTAIKMIVYAEKNFDDNQVKFETVVQAVISKLSFPFNLIPSTAISKFVQSVFDEIKEALDYRG